MAVTPVDQTAEAHITAAPPKGALEELATAVYGAVSSFFKEIDATADRLSAHWLGVEKEEVERLPLTALHPFRLPPKAKPLLAEKLQNRSIQAMLLFLVALRMETQATERHLRAQERAQSRNDHKTQVTKTRDETEKTAKRSTKTGTFAAMFSLAPMLAGPALQAIAPWTGDGGWLNGMPYLPDLTDRVRHEDATKVVRQAAQGPAQFFSQDAQTHSMMLQGITFESQSEAQRALEKGQSASAVIREISQTVGRDVDEAGRLLDAILQSMQRLHQQ